MELTPLLLIAGVFVLSIHGIKIILLHLLLISNIKTTLYV